ncbi:MAG: hypothetical protein KA004_00080 [Verrucomicrobiales bacterium]|nr:hypothetical protein [Verrucomicrobiales bacterium]
MNNDQNPREREGESCNFQNEVRAAWNNPISRRRFLKRTGGAAAGTTIFFQLTGTRQAVADPAEIHDPSGDIKYKLIFDLGGQTQEREGTSTTFDPTLIVVVPEGVGTVRLRIDGVRETDKDEVTWSVQRNANDSSGAKATPDIVVTPDPSDKRNATISAPQNLKGVYGSFLISVGLQGSTLVVGQFIVIRSVIDVATATPKLHWVFAPIDQGGGLHGLFSTNKPQPPAGPFLDFLAHIILRGGNGDEKLGCQRIHLGFIGNLRSTTRFRTYEVTIGEVTHSRFEEEQFEDTHSRLLDKLDGPAANGQWNKVPDSYRSTSEEIPASPYSQPSTGKLLYLIANDSPNFQYSAEVPKSETVKLYIKSLGGILEFEDFIASHSDDFNRAAAIDAGIFWSLEFSAILNHQTTPPNNSATGTCKIEGNFIPNGQSVNFRKESSDFPTPGTAPYVIQPGGTTATDLDDPGLHFTDTTTE